ncbi:hypothetical protein SLA_2984 [Streptomyces laurentii]|uniref:Uncharacterized protein n=1 Tax=Streptomyces laurentii TaxID=39478 RepID=A0A160NYC2_STRLU|nr:hypothetical protein SLA_2984 [Streptomyces laurentii]
MPHRAARQGIGWIRSGGQAAEVLDEVVDFESEEDEEDVDDVDEEVDEDEDVDEEVDEDEDVDEEDFDEVGVLLDDEPRLSLR